MQNQQLKPAATGSMQYFDYCIPQLFRIIGYLHLHNTSTVTFYLFCKIMHRVGKNTHCYRNLRFFAICHQQSSCERLLKTPTLFFFKTASQYFSSRQNTIQACVLCTRGDFTPQLGLFFSL